jgi:capsular polysaccharide transport system permease protein
MPGGLDPGFFWVMGYLPFYLFRGVVNRAPFAIVGSQSLLYHQRITVLDIILAKNLIEGGAVGGAMLVFTLFFGLTQGFWPAHPEIVVFGMLLMLALCHGAALLIAAGSIFSDLFERMTHLFSYLFLGISGSFFMVFWLPKDMQAAALWIPTVNIFEFIRRGFYGDTVPTYFDLYYVGGWIIGLNMFGMAALRHARRSLVI